jgi:oligopeptidase A
MTARIINGAALAQSIRDDVARRVHTLIKKGIHPGLAVIRIGDDPASQIYVNHKVAACQKAGLHSVQEYYPASTTEAQLLQHLDRLNQDPAIHGILVQLPLPPHINPHNIIEAIAPEKDVDGFHISNAGLLMTGQPLFRPCTPYGVMKILESEHISLSGANAVIVGTSNIVGKPMAMLLLAAGATVTLCNSKTRDLAAHTRSADVLVVATGKPGLVTGAMIHPGAIVIDVGIHRGKDGKLYGDVEFESAVHVAGAITPVPGGVGPMTIAMLLVNTLESAERYATARPNPPKPMSTYSIKSNPVLVPIEELIDYAAIEPHHIEPAIKTLLTAARQAVERAVDVSLPPTWEAVIEPLDTAMERLWRSWAVVHHLNTVVNTAELRQIHNDILPNVTEFSSWLGCHVDLYQQYQRLSQAPEFSQWQPVRQRIVKLTLRDFHLSGVSLQGKARDRYATLLKRQAQASQKFAENVLDATNTWALFIEDEKRLQGIPLDVCQAARRDATDAGKTGWKLTLQLPCYLPVMQYAQDRTLREKFYYAYGTIASERGDARFDNSPFIEELLALRAEEAHLLGFNNFAALRLQTRMATSADAVIDFLRDLAARARPYAEQELTQLRHYARTNLGLETLKPWDIAYASESLRQTLYAYSEDEIKQYYPESHVLAGLFDIIEKLFAVRLHECTLSTWHEDVRSVRVEHLNGTLIGHLYLDLYVRAHKQSGAWAEEERNRRLINGSLHLPVVHVVCNFSRPNDGQAALFTHDDITTLFHEMGHALHALLSEVTELGSSPFANLERDAIELPSQFMENFCWEWTVMQKLSAHVDTGKPLPRELYDKLVAARHFQTGMQTLRQIEFSLFDMLLHMHPEKTRIHDVLQLLNTVRSEVAVLQPPPWHRLPHSFLHLFAGDYSAGYYGYKWAEVLSADAYAAFEEAAAIQHDNAYGTLDANLGLRFRQEILAVGSTRPAAESFQAFRGREYRIDALLRHSGMIPSQDS